MWSDIIFVFDPFTFSFQLKHQLSIVLHQVQYFLTYSVLPRDNLLCLPVLGSVFLDEILQVV